MITTIIILAFIAGFFSNEVMSNKDKKRLIAREESKRKILLLENNTLKESMVNSIIIGSEVYFTHKGNLLKGELHEYENSSYGEKIEIRIYGVPKVSYEYKTYKPNAFYYTKEQAIEEITKKNLKEIENVNKLWD